MDTLQEQLEKLKVGFIRDLEQKQLAVSQGFRYYSGKAKHPIVTLFDSLQGFLGVQQGTGVLTRSQIET